MRLLALISLLLAGPALALELPEGAVLTRENNSARDSLALATGPFAYGIVPTRTLEGAVTRQAWRMRGIGLTSAQIMEQFRDQLEADGWQVLFACQDITCGGFDFRFATLVFGEPDLHVDLGDYRYLLVGKGDSLMSLLVSRSLGAGYVQVLRVGPPEQAAPVTTTSTMNGGGGLAGAPSDPETPSDPAPSAPPPPGDIGAQMEQVGFAVLSDLTFQTGSSTLGNLDAPSLAALASYLAANPSKRVTLVGHTDAVGSLQSNIALSRKRARSVRQSLINRHGVAPEQVAAEGVGFLSPMASNQTEAGRRTNRRVEAVLTTTQ